MARRRSLSTSDPVEVGKGKELALVPGATPKTQGFDRKLGDQLYQWSSVRSQYVAEANQSSVQYIVAGGYPWGWYGLGWYWNPWFSSWAFVPGYGYYGSPFGFGFYSPAYFRAYPPASYYVRPGVTASFRVFAPAVACVGGFGGGFGGFHGGFWRPAVIASTSCNFESRAIRETGKRGFLIADRRASEAVRPAEPDSAERDRQFPRFPH
jgi:hypothetical protein